MLFLVTAHRHAVCLEKQDVGRHQDRVAEQCHGNPLVRIAASGLLIGGDRRLVGMCTIHEPFRRHGGQDPGKLGDLRHVGLTIEDGVLRIQAQRQPGGGDFHGGTLYLVRILVLHQRVQIRQEIEIPSLRGLAGRNAGTDRPDIITDVRGARRRDTRQPDFSIHSVRSQ